MCEECKKAIVPDTGAGIHAVPDVVARIWVRLLQHA